jgi:copper homeostasis protein
MPTNERTLLEVCVASIDDAQVAQRGGADRLELNAALALDGLTPSAGMLQSIKRVADLPVIAMIRPRPGGFCYSGSEFDVMRTDAEFALRAGVDGIAFGILTEDGTIDKPRCRQMRELAAGRQAIFHRAFDVVADPYSALESLIELGFTRVLTSGRRQTALEGAKLIAELVMRSKGRVEILPGAGVNRSTVRELVLATGCTQVHGSFRVKSCRSRSGPVSILFGDDAAGEESVDIDEVKAVRSLLDIVHATNDD